MPSFGKKTLIRENKTIGLDKVAQPNISLGNFLFMPNKEAALHQLSVLKKRNCRFSQEKLRLIFKERREKTALNQMVFFDKYNDLLVFEPSSPMVLIQVLYQILDYNRSINVDEDQQFLCFFEPLLKKLAAVTKIQQFFRAKWFR